MPKIPCPSTSEPQAEGIFHQLVSYLQTPNVPICPKDEFVGPDGHVTDEGILWAIRQIQHHRSPSTVRVCRSVGEDPSQAPMNHDPLPSRYVVLGQRADKEWYCLCVSNKDYYVHGVAPTEKDARAIFGHWLTSIGASNIDRNMGRFLRMYSKLIYNCSSQSGLNALYCALVWLESAWGNLSRPNEITLVDAFRSNVELPTPQHGTPK